jgi:hypothetical protein
MRQHNVDCITTAKACTKIETDGTVDDPIMDKVNNMVAERMQLLQKEFTRIVEETSRLCGPSTRSVTLYPAWRGRQKKRSRRN